MQGRCAAVVVYGRHLAVLPAGGAGAGGLDDDEVAAAAAFDQGAGIARQAAGTPAALQRSYLVDLATLGIREVLRVFSIPHQVPRQFSLAERASAMERRLMWCFVGAPAPSM